MSWPYAELSKLAKANGGPDQLVDSLVSNAIKKGRFQMLPVVVVALAAGSATVVAYQKWKEFFADKNNKAEIEAASEENIQGINDYDAKHPEENIDMKEGGENQNE